METFKARNIFKNKPGLCWDNYFSGDNIFDHAGKNGYGMLSTVRRVNFPKGVPSQYIHKKVTDPRKLVDKCSGFNDPIVIVNKKKITYTNST